MIYLDFGNISLIVGLIPDIFGLISDIFGLLSDIINLISGISGLISEIFGLISDHNHWSDIRQARSFPLLTTYQISCRRKNTPKFT